MWKRHQKASEKVETAETILGNHNREITEKAKREQNEETKK